MTEDRLYAHTLLPTLTLTFTTDLGVGRTPLIDGIAQIPLSGQNYAVDPDLEPGLPECRALARSPSPSPRRPHWLGGERLPRGLQASHLTLKLLTSVLVPVPREMCSE